MEIKWLGHSCFLLSNEAGVRILIDPMCPQTGYTPDPVEADVVLSSHSHGDHSYFELALGNPVKITEVGEYDVKDVHIKGVHTFHDNECGTKRGDNIVFIVEMDGVRVVHAGDLGHLLSDAQINEIGRTDVLLSPIGGVYTIDAQEALELANMLHANILIPMHYKTIDCKYDNLGELMPFLTLARNCAIHRLRQADATITPDSLGIDRIIALYYDRHVDEDN